MRSAAPKRLYMPLWDTTRPNLPCTPCLHLFISFGQVAMRSAVELGAAKLVYLHEGQVPWASCPPAAPPTAFAPLL